MIHISNYWVFIAISGILCLFMLGSARLEGRSFGLMTGVWTGIHMVAALVLQKHIYVPPDERAVEMTAHVVYWMGVNILLDVAYGFVGLTLLILGGATRRVLTGFGAAVLFQAVGLLLIDILFFRQVMLLMGE